MRVRFVGGPYDGREIDSELLNRYARSEVVAALVVLRAFWALPRDSEVWDRLTLGEEATLSGEAYYEQFPGPEGPYCHFVREEEFQRAKKAIRLKADPRARTALSALDPDDRWKGIERAVELQDQPPDKWPPDRVTPLDGAQQLYLLRVSTDLRALIRPAGSGDVEVVDVVREETLRMFLKRYEDAGTPQ